MYVINEEKMFYDIADGQAIVINFDTGMYYGMSSLGSAVLDLLLKGAKTEEIGAALAVLPGCPTEITERLCSFVNTLLEKGILRSVPDIQKDMIELGFGQEALLDGFKLEVNEYAEAQDLILADPIHEVDVDMGWPIMKKS